MSDKTTKPRKDVQALWIGIAFSLAITTAIWALILSYQRSYYCQILDLPGTTGNYPTQQFGPVFQHGVCTLPIKSSFGG